MSWAAVSTDHWATDARVTAEKETFASEANAADFLWVEVAPPRPSVRGRLALLIEGAIERALESQGAPPPALTSGTSFEPTLHDLLRRTRVSGSAGIALWIPSLASVAVASVLDPDDSSTLRAWLRATRDQPVKIGFHCENLPFGVHLEPLPLAALLRPEVRHDDEPSERHSSPVSAESLDSEEPLPETHGNADEEPGDEERLIEERAPETPAKGLDSFAESARTMASELGDDDETSWLREALMELSTPPPRACVEDDETLDEPAEESSVPVASVAPRLDLAFADPEPIDPPPPVEEPALSTEEMLALEAHCREIEAASGPKPLAVVERLFTTAYMPLRAALDRHPELSQRLHDVADEWARAFEKSYSDAFDALRVRNKRPSMLVDVPDLALRIARLHGARSTQLLLVDGMRFDLAESIHERLRAQVGQRAACAERFLLWSALPTTTAAQVELIGRGPSGLKDFTGDVQSDLVVARGRKACTIRRLKAGHRELLKLDVVEARLTEPGGAEGDAFALVADEAAQRIAAYFEGLQPRTLVMVFGDHGFVIDRKDGVAEVRHGGGSPEEVLVPAFAWLVGAMH